MGGNFDRKFWHRSSEGKGAALTECVHCVIFNVVGNLLQPTCVDDKVSTDMTGFNDFDVDRAQEVMDTLRDVLDVDGIKWENKSPDAKEFEGGTFVLLRTHITYRGKFYSVILGTGTHGWEDYKLELLSDQVNDGNPVGNLTVTEVIDIMKNGYNPEV